MKFETPEQLAPAALRDSQTEIAVLSILMNFPQAFDEVGHKLECCHFSDGLNRSVFAEIQRQMAKGAGTDLLTLAEELEGVVEISELHAISQAHDFGTRGIRRHVEVLIERYKARQLHMIAGKMMDLAFEETVPVQERIDVAQAELAKLDDVADSDDWVDAHRAAIEHLDLIDARSNGSIQGMPTGLSSLDEMLDGGLQRGNLVVLGARPAMGKTALALSIGLFMARNQAVGFLSMEMPHSDVRDRQAAILSKAPIGTIKRPQKGLEYDRIVDGVEKAKTLRWFVSDKGGLNILQLRSKARALKRTRALDVLIVDYIGLMSGLDSKMSRAYQIEEISRGLKTLAKELDIVVICLAQVNRGATERVNQVPGLQDLRDSGAIEQDADIVGFIHRPIEANPNLGDSFRNYGLLRIAKNRQGRTGEVHLHYNGELTYFSGWGGVPPTAQPEASAPQKRGMGA